MSAYEPQAFGDLLKAGKKTYRPIQGQRDQKLIFGGQRYYRLPAESSNYEPLVGPEVKYGYPVKLLPPHVESSVPVAQIAARPTYTQLGARPTYVQVGARPSYL